MEQEEGQILRNEIQNWQKEVRAEHTHFEDVVDTDVMRMAWQSEYWKIAGGQSRDKQDGAEIKECIKQSSGQMMH